MSLKYCQTNTLYQAGSGVIIGATSIILTSLTDIYGNVLTMTNFGAKGYGSCEPDSTNEESFTFTGITANANGTYTLTGVSTALAVSPYTESSGLVRAHAGGTKVVISDTTAFWNTFGNKQNDEALVGRWTTPVTPANPNDLANKSYVDSVAVSGAPNATTATQGLVQLATQAQVDAKTAVGGTGASLAATPALARSTLLSDYVIDTGSANAYAIAPSPAITAYATGQIFSFKSTNTNTLASTLNVNALGVKTIKRSGSDLGAGDIVSGQIYIVEYDGTNFQLLNSTNSTPAGSMQMYAGAAAPTGWLLCDGTSYLQATYPVLFAVISTTFGSADGTHFNVPDMRGRVPVGVGTGTGGGTSGTGLPAGGSALTAVARAGWKGEETHVLTEGELATHNHSGNYATGSGGATSGLLYTTAGLSATAANVVNDGSNTAHNNIQPVMGINFIIKV